MSEYTNFNPGYVAPPPKSSAGQIIGILLVVAIVIVIVIIIIYFVAMSGNTNNGGTTPTTGCTSNSNCSGGQKCDTSSGNCVNCLANSDCFAGQFCNPKSHTCVTCYEDSQCSGSTPHCNVNTHKCVGCVSNSDCFGSTPYCEPGGSTCVQCINSLNCPDPTTQACNVNGQCVNAFTCPNGVTCDGQTINGVPNQTICTDGLREYKCSSSGWQFDGNLCVCPTQQYWIYNGQWYNDNYLDAGGYTQETCNNWCTSQSQCSATLFDTTTGHCWLKNFTTNSGSTLYIRDPNNPNYFVTYKNKYANGNVFVNYINTTETQCVTNCANYQGSGTMAALWVPDGTCYCQSTTVLGNTQYRSSFKEINYP